MPDALELSISFTSDEDDENSSIWVSLFCSQSGTRTKLVLFDPPLDDAVLAELRWYLEVYSGWPTGPDYARAERIESQLETWGRMLLESITPDRDSIELLRQFIDVRQSGKLLTIDATDPRVLRLPWELLADQRGHIFARRISVRRRLQQATADPISPFALPVRVLVVVSRPKGEDFIDPRAVSQPLLDSLDVLGERAAVEFLYPPTLQALSERLEDTTAPPVHVVHFDGHGVYDRRLGLGYLLFEDEEHEKDQVDANRLGILLYDCGVPLMVLNACQSASQDEANPYASVAARLIRAGVGSVLAMNYSVLVDAARKFVQAFYGALAGGRSVGQAVDLARRALLADEKRGTLTRRNAEDELAEETFRLRDWFLPALYQQSADPVVFAQAAPLPPRAPRPAALDDPNAPGGLPPEPLHGFQGRSREMLHLERALAEKQIVVLHGFGGMGKTALAAEAGRWFYRAGRFSGGAAFISFEHGGSLEQLCSWVGQAVSGDENFAIHGAGGDNAGPVARVGALLRERPALIVLDNFESVLGPDPLMPADELQSILDAVCAWVTAPPSPNLRSAHLKSPRLLITTRDTTFHDRRFAPSQTCAHVQLRGLAQSDALALAAAVLDAYGIDRATIPRESLIELMDLLGGHPLSLYLVLPHLREHAPDELIARFEELLPGFVQGEARERNESLAVSLEFSLRRLGAETRAALPALGVFQGAAFEDDLLFITEIDAELWKTARAELEAAALVSVEPVPGVAPPFLRFHPTLLPALRAQLADEQRAALEARYWQRYYAVANFLYHSDTQNPHGARAIAARELPNLRRALDLALDAGAVTEAVDFADSVAKFLNNFGRWREREALLDRVRAVAARQSAAGEAGAGPLTKTAYLLASREGEALRQGGRAAEAERVFRALLARLEGETAYDAAYDHATTLVWLGRCLSAQGRREQAVEWQRRALGEFERLSGSSDSAKEMLGKVYTNLGDNLMDLGRFDEAQQAYESGLDISRQVDDHRSVGVKLGQLGTLALQRRDLPEAKERYTEALETFRALGEPQVEAVVLHQLGRVAEEAKAWEEAERNYREAVRIRERIRDLPELAKSYNQLALVAEGAGRPGDAEQWYLRAQEIFEQLRDPAAQAKVLNNLAGLCLSQSRLDEAADYARRAAEIKETLDLSAEPWTTYSILAQIAEARGRGDEAAGWRRKEQESYAAYAGAAHRLPGWAPAFIDTVVGAVQGDQAARQELEQVFPDMEKSQDWRNLPPVVRRILGGEDDLDQLCSGLDHIDAYIIRTILARLSGEAAPPSPLSRSPSPAPGERGPGGEGPDNEDALSLDGFLALVAQACRPDAPRGLAVQLHGATRNMATQEGLPDGVRALGRVLNRVLSGERDPDLSGLPPELAGAVRELLAGLG